MISSGWTVVVGIAVNLPKAARVPFADNLADRADHRTNFLLRDKTIPSLLERTNVICAFRCTIAWPPDVRRSDLSSLATRSSTRIHAELRLMSHVDFKFSSSWHLDIASRWSQLHQNQPRSQGMQLHLMNLIACQSCWRGVISN